MHRGLGNLLLLCVGLGVAATLGEGAARVLTPGPLPRREPQIRYDPHPIRGFTLRPNQTAYTYSALAHVDALGFRSNGGDIAEADSGPVVLGLGDSFTFGLGIPDSATWPAQLERFLAAHLGRPLRVVNTGVVSYGAFQEMSLLREKGLALRPKVIIHQLSWNDYGSPRPPRAGAPSPLTPDGEFVWDVPSPNASFPRRVGQWVLDHSRLVTLVWRATHPTEYARAFGRLIRGDIGPAAQWQPVVGFYHDLRHLSDSVGAQLYVIVMPIVDLVGRSDPAARVYPDFAKHLLQEEGIRTLDGFAILREHGVGRSVFLTQSADSHLGPAGYRLIAEALADSLAQDTMVTRLLPKRHP